MISREDVLKAPVPSSRWQSLLYSSYLVVFLTFGVLGGWSAVAKIDSGVVASGVIAVESSRKTIQHLEGGIVAEILVRNGSVVKTGDVLMRLDPTRNAASNELYRQQYLIARALEARLIAQRELADKVEMPAEVLELRREPLVAAAINDNQRQFEARRQVFASGLDVLQRQIGQAENDIRQASLDLATAEQQLKTIETELPALKQLLERGLVTLPRVTTLERQQQQLLGVVSKAAIDTARSRERIAELGTRREQLKQEYVQDAAVQLAEIRKTLSDLSQQRLVSQDALSRVEIRAPVDGSVQQMRVFTVGGVIKAGDPILDIVPLSDELVVRAKVSPIDIDRMRIAKIAEIRLPQFVRYQDAVIKGEVRTLANDAVFDPQTRESFYDAEILVDRSTLPEEIRDRLTAGMVTQVIVPTGERTVLAYIVAPLLNRLALGMREQ